MPSMQHLYRWSLVIYGWRQKPFWHQCPQMFIHYCPERSNKYKALSIMEQVFLF